MYACDSTVVKACYRFLASMFSVFCALLTVFVFICVVHLMSD